MKGLKGGPELKIPELKVPRVAKDLYDDLRDRRLLPLVALLIVAIVATPLLLRDDFEPVPERPPAVMEAQTEASSQASQLTAVKAAPGLRDYRRRLRGRVATDPFVQRYSAPVLKGAKLQSESSTGSGGSEPKTSTSETGEAKGGGAGEAKGDGSGEAKGGGSGGGAEPGGKGDAPPATGVTSYTWVLDVQISHTEEKPNGTTEMGEPQRREDVKTLTPLPGPKAPVVTFMGRSPHTGKAVFMISKDVTAVFGEVDCIVGTDSCELVEMEPGFPVTFEYGPAHVRYKLTVIKVELAKAETQSDGF